MCRNIRPLFNFDPPATDAEIQPAIVFGFGTDEQHFHRSTRWRFAPQSPKEV